MLYELLSSVIIKNMDISEFKKRAGEIRDLYDEFNQKRAGVKWTRLQLAQGFVGDVGDLQKLAMAKDGLREIENVDEKLAHELSDCLWSVLVLAEKYDIDIEKEFLKTMDELEKRITDS